MNQLKLNQLAAISESWLKIINYELIRGNELWRFAGVLVVILITIAAGRVAQYLIGKSAQQKEKKTGTAAVTIFLRCLAKPISVAIFALGLFICKTMLIFADGAINPVIGRYWTDIARAVGAIAIAYAFYRLVDVIEYYLLQWTSKTRTKLDDMLVPVLRKSLRITIAIIAALWIADGILGAQIRTILLSAGVGGIAIALAAKDTVANFFGSITIFADRPFQIDELVRIGGHLGSVQEVGFRSTKIRTLQGHMVTIPNNEIANSIVENVGKRPFIRRTSNITITYDSGHKKAKRAVEIIKEILADIPQVNAEPKTAPKVYFNDFNEWSLNIYMSYWFRPGDDWWGFYEINQKVNFEMMKRFEKEKIEFAFPTQTLYVKKD